MSEKPRRWFQIHLSTAIVLMFVAGGLMWANVRPHRDPDFASLSAFGWPLDGAICQNREMFGNAAELELNDPEYFSRVKIFSPSNLLINAVVGLGTIAAVMGLSEFIIRRRREARTL